MKTEKLKRKKERKNESNSKVIGYYNTGPFTDKLGTSYSSKFCIKWIK